VPFWTLQMVTAVPEKLPVSGVQMRYLQAMLTLHTFSSHWTGPVVEANFFVRLHLVGALALGPLGTN
jgi:hypothetical protein